MRFNVLNCGRQWGKTTTGQRLCAEVATDGKRVAYVAPTYAMAEQFYAEMVELLGPVITRKTENKRIEIGQGFVRIWSAENGADRIRGQRYNRLVIDEAAMIVGLVDVWEKVLLPTLAFYEGDAYFLSTPRRGGGFEELYRKAEHDPEWASWTLPTALNPFIPRTEIERARRDNSAENFAQEWEASFEASESDLVHPEFDRLAHIRGPRQGWRDCTWRVVGIDPGGGDPTAIVPLGVTREAIHQYGEFYRRGDVTIEAMAEYLTKLGPLDAVVVGETGGNVITNTLRGLGFPAFKADMKRNEGIEVQRWMLQTKRLTLDPACQHSIREFATYRWAKRRDGETGERYSTQTPVDHHADAMDARRYGLMYVVEQLLRPRETQPTSFTIERTHSR